MHDSTVQFSIQSLDKKTFQDLIIHVISFFKSHEMTNCKNEIEWFLQDLLQCDKAQLYEKQKGLINTKHYTHINNFVNQRAKGVPFQHLLKKASFYGRDFIINSNVLIPRPETEVLIDILKEKTYKKVLDIGTGTGAIAITANLENIAESVDAIDIDIQALKIAKSNQQKFKTSKVNFFKMDIFISYYNYYGSKTSAMDF